VIDCAQCGSLKILHGACQLPCCVRPAAVACARVHHGMADGCCALFGHSFPANPIISIARVGVVDIITSGEESNHCDSRRPSDFSDDDGAWW
jgi:hypothetical protein